MLRPFAKKPLLTKVTTVVKKFPFMHKLRNNKRYPNSAKETMCEEGRKNGRKEFKREENAHFVGTLNMIQYIFIIYI